MPLCVQRHHFIIDKKRKINLVDPARDNCENALNSKPLDGLPKFLQSHDLSSMGMNKILKSDRVSIFLKVNIFYTFLMITCFMSERNNFDKMYVGESSFCKTSKTVKSPTCMGSGWRPMA